MIERSDPMRKMFYSSFVILSILLVIMIIPTKAHPGRPDGGWKEYKGAWFSIKYPGSFRVYPSLKSLSSSEGYDSVFFISPDSSVEFYVFSPQWNGGPSDIALQPDTEEYVAQKEEKRNSRIVRFITIRARDKSYLRSYVDTEDTDLNTRLVLGIRYTDQKAYEKYKQFYLDFKASIRQYAD